MSSLDVIRSPDHQQIELVKKASLALSSTTKRNQSVSSDKNDNKSILLTDRQQREANLGTILVGISLLFICCQSIKIIPDVSSKYSVVLIYTCSTKFYDFAASVLSISCIEF